ncbi:MAG: murein biosynthesis integral membrane protein MurJ [Bdellovibrio sp. CG12_big_fil_rev_8_21_14_0_65_39_13]|nr:MAG: murein biosynthesis integral membrane protein MurJ [Bdellovibrio sp. CG22_combo_CG10-13_8_21_14_all_39_27]PIQ58832.1 MAG: murein biosynthesis integral membrane protein MurJ [Bdellovibrio sp. CG12_big_fil_rev_8_21_14_0_65_39_13]PIR35490.1 MAG: murein biosynthesis integral membrane protein MurJ [Bdellovibrio sp. CG11_big_fil_rev_8_21_14_0_20_39_38]PJB54186.1 MAG: murein biosynthesis integral membrane protein MurJ [Bdellovibrio sp. CG_4_9_14_3_um_filter_39_7]
MKAAQNANAQKRIFVSTLKMAVATFSSRVFGLVREQVTAAMFGASGLTDAFMVAYRVPNLLRDLFAEGAFSSAFVPIFTEVRLKDEEAAKRLLWSLFVVLGIITLTISGLIIIFAPQVTMWMTDDAFTADTQRYELTVMLVRLMAPFLSLVSMAALFMGALNSLKVFFVPSFAPVFFNVLMILSMLILPPYLEARGIHAIASMGIGVLVGGFAQMLFQVPMIIKQKYGWTGPLSFWNKDIKRIFNRVGIGTIGIAATQINILITTILATGAGVGAVSWLTYAFRLFQFPVGILSVSIAGSNLVHFSDAWKGGRFEEARSSLRASYILSWMTVAPAMALMFALSQETVSLIFERGRFLAADTLPTSQALTLYAWGLPFYGLYKIFAPTFYTLDKPRLPVAISIFSIAINLVFCIWATPRYGFQMLALGTSISIFINCLIQSFLLNRLLGLKFSFFINLKWLKIVLSAGATYFLVMAIKNYFPILEQPLHLKALNYFIVCAGGAFGYGAALFLMGEGQQLRRLLKRKK